MRQSIGALCVSLLTIGCSCNPETPEQSTHGAPGTRAPEVDAQAAAKSDSAACFKLQERLLQLYGALPASFSEPSSDPERLTHAVRGVKDLADKVLAECRDELEDVQILEARFVLARCWFVLSKVFQQELRAELSTVPAPQRQAQLRERMQEYYRAAIDLARTAAEELPASHRFQPAAWKLLGQLHAAARNDAGAREAYEAFLSQHGENAQLEDESAAVTLFLSTILRRLQAYEEAIRVLEEALERFPDAPEYADFLDGLWTCSSAIGDLGRMREVVDRVQREFPERLQRSHQSARVKDKLRTYLYYALYRDAFLHLAEGSREKARAGFEAQLKALSDRRASGEAVGQTWGPYGMLASHALEFLRERAYRPPAYDLDLGDGWISDADFRLSNARGKAIALVIRRDKDPRSAPFVVDLSRFCAERPEYEMVTLVPQSRGADTLTVKRRVASELLPEGYQGRLGLDASDDHRVARGFGNELGSATFVIIDATGQLVWSQMDPRAIDVRLAQTLLRQLGGAE